MLTERALTVNLHISQWSARKYDDKVSKDIEQQHEAEDAGRYNKSLIDKERMNEVQKVARKIRDFHYENTLPWGDNGERLLPSDNYFQYMEKLSELKREYDEVVEKFTSEYEELVEKSRKRLGKMFNPNDYPRKEVVKGKFGIKTVLLPVAEADFRVNLEEEEIEELKKQAEKELNSRLKDAITDVWQRIKSQLFHMKEKLSDKEAIFRNSLFENVKSLSDILPRLNVTKDPKIQEICEDIKSLISDPDAVRKSFTLREYKASEVERIINKYSNYF